MRLLVALTYLLASATLVFGQPPGAPNLQPDPAKQQFKRGLVRTPQHRSLAAPKFVAAAAPSQFGVVPPKMLMWGNDQYGDCVSAEEAFALSDWTFRCTGTQVVPTNAEVVAFARKYGYLNGANLTDVMDTMQAHGMVVGGKTYKIGPYATVDYTAPLTLASAIYTGPVNIAIDANALPSGAGNAQGWYSLKGGNYPNTDHCVSLCGYGPASYLYSILNVPLPAAVPPTTPGYLLYTWSTVGFVTQDWLNGTCTEAWVRNPTTVGFSPTPTPPTPPVPPVPPTPVPPVVGFSGTVTYTYQNGVVTGVAVVPAASPAPPACGTYTVPSSVARLVTYQPAAYTRPRLFNLRR